MVDVGAGLIAAKMADFEISAEDCGAEKRLLGWLVMIPSEQQLVQLHLAIAAGIIPLRVRCFLSP